MTEEERAEILKKIQEHQMRIVELQKIEDIEERHAAYEALPPFDVTPEQIHEAYNQDGIMEVS